MPVSQESERQATLPGERVAWGPLLKPNDKRRVPPHSQRRVFIKLPVLHIFKEESGAGGQPLPIYLASVDPYSSLIFSPRSSTLGSESGPQPEWEVEAESE